MLKRRLTRWQPVWRSAPRVLSLRPREIHVWRSFISTQPGKVELLRRLLSEDEAARAESLVALQDRVAFITTRARLRTILSRYLGISPRAIRFVCNSWGKPHLSPKLRSPIEFNTSHARGMALFAVTHEQRVGIDVELIRLIKEFSKVVERVGRMGREASVPENLEEFFAWWTRHEAYLKGIGQPLLACPQSESAMTNGESGADLWSSIGFEPASGYVACVASEARASVIRFWNCLIS